MTIKSDHPHRRTGCGAVLFILLFPLTMYALAGCGPIRPASIQVTSTPFPSQKINPTQTKSIGMQSVNDDLGLLIAESEKNMPRANTEGFIIPTKSEELAFQKMVLAIEDNNPELAAHSALTYNYELIKFSDHGNFGAESYILREQLPITKGWGVYIFSIRPSRNIIIEAPHPLADKKTPEIALDIFRALNARALIISGTHRDANRDGSADSAHAPESIFQTVHLALFQYTQQLSQSAIFLQIHGFAAENHPHYPQIVIGHNWKHDPEKDRLLQNIEEALQSNNIKAGVCDGKKYQNLCGASNLQSSTTKGGIFIHIELNESLRHDDSVLIESLKQAIMQYRQ
jgi:hypothetical protein